MATPNPPPKPAGKRSYISSSGNVLETPPFSARLSRLGDDMYNFLGLYFVSLFSLDPYTAAQGSQFNTRQNPNSYQTRVRWNAGTNRTGGGLAGGSGFGSSGPRGGGGGGGGPSGGGGGGSGGGRRMGTVDDVRGPECGSCG